MRLTWSKITRPDGATHPQIEVSDSSDWDLFNEVAAALEVALDGQWTAQLDGLDQRFWDLEAGAGRITLHLEHYLGITIYQTDGAEASPSSGTLLEKAHESLANWDPP